ncbi:MAG: hypothetical protein ACLS3S_02875 [Streptococcus salivarius]
MYAMSLVSIPQYVFMLIQFIHPESKWTSGAIKALTVGQPLWLVVYLFALCLGLAFAFVNVSGEQISERMRKSGNYIYGVYPGQKLVPISTIWCLDLVLSVPFTCSLWRVLQC